MCACHFWDSSYTPFSIWVISVYASPCKRQIDSLFFSIFSFYICIFGMLLSSQQTKYYKLPNLDFGKWLQLKLPIEFKSRQIILSKTLEPMTLSTFPWSLTKGSQKEKSCTASDLSLHSLRFKRWKMSWLLFFHHSSLQIYLSITVERSKWGPSLSKNMEM